MRGWGFRRGRRSEPKKNRDIEKIKMLLSCMNRNGQRHVIRIMANEFDMERMMEGELAKLNARLAKRLKKERDGSGYGKKCEKRAELLKDIEFSHSVWCTSF